MIDRTNYSMGFAFSPAMYEVALVQKLRPAELRGRWTGIGGHIENGESAVQCMVREFEEEAGLVSVENQWLYYGQANIGSHSRIYLFYSTTLPIHKCNTTTDEMVEVYRTSDVEMMDMALVDHTKWFIRLALAREMWKSSLSRDSEISMLMTLP